MTYLERRRARMSFDALKKEVVFGIVVSSLLVGIGGWCYFAVIGANDRLSAGAAILGAIGWLVSVIIPSLWKLPEKATGFLMRKVGGVLFAALLVIVYLALIVPVGLLLREINGPGPIVIWGATQPAGALEGWHSKEVAFDLQVGRRGKPSLGKRFFTVLQFFANRGLYIFLPALVVLLALGAALFFVKSSALAPFIYTLF